MKTAGEFRDAGGVFIKGDMVACHLNCVDNIEDIGDCLFSINSNEDRYKNIWNPSNIGSFAWRTNTGVKPGFVGEVELMDGNHNTGVKHSSKVNWEKHPQAGDANICQWRPHLPSIQTETPEEKAALDKIDAHVSDESKPVYTQAMCDAGNVALIGMQVSYPSGKGELALGADNEGDCIVIEDGRYKRVDFSILKPIQTEREKALEGARKMTAGKLCNMVFNGSMTPGIHDKVLKEKCDQLDSYLKEI